MEEDRAAQPLTPTASDDFTKSNREKGGWCSLCTRRVACSHPLEAIEDQHIKVWAAV